MLLLKKLINYRLYVNNKIMETTYKPIDCNFYDVLEAAATENRYVKIYYYTEIGEMLSAMAVVKNIYTKDKMEFLVLSTGEEIRLDRIVRIDDVPAPNYDSFDDFSCDC